MPSHSSRRKRRQRAWNRGREKESFGFEGPLVPKLESPNGIALSGGPVVFVWVGVPEDGQVNAYVGRKECAVARSALSSKRGSKSKMVQIRQSQGGSCQTRGAMTPATQDLMSRHA